MSAAACFIRTTRWWPDRANELYEYIGEQRRKCESIADVQTGRFGADMKVELLNDGPFTVILDSNELM